MKKLSIILLLATLAGAVQAALPQPDLILRAYFAGPQKVPAGPNAAAYTAEFSSPQAMVLRKQTADKLAVWLAGWLQQKSGVVVPGGAAKLRPLLDDLQQCEWMMEARAAAATPDFALAIKVDSARAQAWQAGLKPFLPAASFNTLPGWLIFDSGTSAPRLGATIAQRATMAQPGWFSLDVNWPRLAQWFPELARLALPETMFTVTRPGDDFHVDGKFIFPQPPALNLENWKIPSNLIHGQFNSFTAVRGFASWLASQPWAQPYAITPMPNQAFIWADPDMPFQSYCAVPVPNPASALTQLYGRLQPEFSPNPAGGPAIPSAIHFTLQKTSDMINFAGMPLVAPFIQAVNASGGGFLLAGGFPDLGGQQNLPVELSHQLTGANVVFYHWEVTSQRMKTLIQPMQLSLMAKDLKQLDGNSAAYKWVDNLGTNLNSTVTEITRTAPDQFTFSRSAPGIFTAAELYALANWLDAGNFPGCDLTPPPIRNVRHIHPKVPATPSPGTK